MCLSHCSHSLLRGERENLSEEVALRFVISPAGNPRRVRRAAQTQKHWTLPDWWAGAPKGSGPRSWSLPPDSCRLPGNLEATLAFLAG